MNPDQVLARIDLEELDEQIYYLYSVAVSTKREQELLEGITELLICLHESMVKHSDNKIVISLH